MRRAMSIYGSWLIVLVAAHGLVAPAEVVGQSSWAELLTVHEPDRLGQVPPLVPFSDRMECGWARYDLPDSLALVSEAVPPVLAPSVWRWSGSNWSRTRAPTVPDTLRARVVRVTCAWSLRDSPLRGLSEVILDRGGVIFSIESASIRPPQPRGSYYPVHGISTGGRIEEVQMVPGPDTTDGVPLLVFRRYNSSSVQAVRQSRRDSIAARQQAERQERSRERAEAAREADARRAERIEGLGRSLGWPRVTTSWVIARQVMIGMTGDMVRAACGSPSRINRTVTVAGQTEQWVYAIDRYVYLTDGRVTAMQVSSPSGGCQPR